METTQPVQSTVPPVVQSISTSTRVLNYLVNMDSELSLSREPPIHRNWLGTGGMNGRDVCCHSSQAWRILAFGSHWWNIRSCGGSCHSWLVACMWCCAEWPRIHKFPWLQFHILLLRIQIKFHVHTTGDIQYYWRRPGLGINGCPARTICYNMMLCH